MKFTIMNGSRFDGRSDSDVIIDLVKRSNPCDIFTYDQLAEELEAGTNRTFDRQAIQKIASKSLLRLSKETSRALQAVKNVGYQIAEANQHGRLATERRRKSNRQLTKGLAILKHVRWEEMDENQRQAHQGQLMVLDAIVTQQQSMEQRMRRIEDAIKKGLKKPNED